MQRSPTRPSTPARGVIHVKKLLALVVAVVFVAGSAGLVLAQTQTAPPAAGKKAEKTMPGKSANGTVKPATAASIPVAAKDNQTNIQRTFTQHANTSIRQ